MEGEGKDGNLQYKKYKIKNYTFELKANVRSAERKATKPMIGKPNGIWREWPKNKF